MASNHVMKQARWTGAGALLLVVGLASQWQGVPANAGFDSGEVALRRDGATARAQASDFTSGSTSEPTAPAARLLVQSCLGCHRQGSASTIPAIHGLRPATLTRMMGEFKRGERSSTIMNRIARGYSDDEIQLLAKGLLE